MLDLLYSKGSNLVKTIRKLVEFVADYTTVIKPNRVFARKPNNCKHPVGYKRNIPFGLA